MLNRWIKRSHTPPTINALCDRYLEWAREYYQKPDREGKRRSTREADQQQCAINALRRARAQPEDPLSPTLGELHPSEICAELLYVARDWMEQQDLVRGEINKRLHRLRRVFRWAAQPPRRWIAPEVPADLKLVEPLQRGRTSARESQPIRSAPRELISALEAHLAEQQAAEDATTAMEAREMATMLDLHLHTGMRTHEMAEMRRTELHEVDGRMVYLPGEHKTQHHGKARNIFLGPIGRRIAQDWLMLLDADPATAERQTMWRWATGPLYRDRMDRYFKAIFSPPLAWRCKRVPTIGRKKGTRQETRRQWQDRLGPEEWAELLTWQAAHRCTPGQFRHNFASKLEHRYGEVGKRAASKLLDHSDLRTTEIYIDPDMHAALRLLDEVG